MPTLSDKNKHISDYICHYARLNTTIDFAVLIEGKWGCGKTHLVNSCIEKLDTTKFIKVSLYGLKTVSDIENKIFEYLHPILSNEKLVLAGKLAKGILKGALKVDLDGDGVADGSMQVAIPEIDLTKYMIDIDNCVLVFDDLERCLIPINELFGYLNHFVEKNGYKVIVIGDTTKIPTTRSSQDNTIGQTAFLTSKEKLFGKSLLVEADVENLFDSILEEGLIKQQALVETLKNNRKEIINIFHKSKLNNLRLLKRSFLEFERVWNTFNSDVVIQENLQRHFIVIFFTCYLEIHSGTVESSDLKKIIGPEDWLKMYEDNQDKESNSLTSDFNDKYSEYFNYFIEPLLSINCWIDILANGKIDKEKVNDLLLNSKYFYDENTLAWKKLWHLHELEDEDFRSLMKQIQRDLENYTYNHYGQILHVIGIFLYLDKYDLYEIYFDTPIDSYFMSYIDHLHNSGKLQFEEKPEWENKRLDSFEGLMFFEKENSVFEKLDVHIQAKIKKMQHENLKKRANGLAILMNKKPEALYDLLTHSEYGSGKYESTPILHLIDIELLVQNFLKSPNKYKHLIADVIYHRYKRKSLSMNLVLEHQWLEKVIDKVIEESKKLKGTITYLVVIDCVKKIQTVEKVLRDCTESQELPNQESDFI